MYCQLLNLHIFTMIVNLFFAFCDFFKTPYRNHENGATWLQNAFFTRKQTIKLDLIKLRVTLFPKEDVHLYITWRSIPYPNVGSTSHSRYTTYMTWHRTFLGQWPL
jgi:hypothetical protein